ncbi:MAG: sugar phosphate isomerase/epimerase family protein [Promethearchaeota archaeon]
MELGISSLGFIIEMGLSKGYQNVFDLLYRSTEACLTIAEEKDLNLVELVIDPPDIENDEKRALFIDLVNSYSIRKQVHGPFVDVNLCSYNSGISKASVDIYKDTAKLCEEISVKIMTIHPGLANFLIKDYNKQQLKHAIDQLLNFISKYNLIICLENMTQKAGIMLDEYNIEEIFSFINNESLFLTYDTSHFYTTNGDIERLWDKFHNKIKNVHLVDNFTTESDTHPVLGTGKINFKLLFNIMKKYYYKGPLIIELSSGKDLDKSLNFINRFL